MSTGTQDTNAQSMHALPKLEPIDARNESVQNLLTRPHKCILSDLDMLVWERSQAHDCILLFLMHLSEACTGCPTRDVVWDNYTTYSTSKSIVDRVLALLIHLDSWTDEIEPLSGPQRFGNLAFRSWGARLAERINELHQSCLPDYLHIYTIELCSYLMDAFGSFIRIDYGTGHELNFIAWLAYMYRLGAFQEEEFLEQRLALEVIPAYLRVSWHLQDRYSLEPAGSHGVWGLDDFHFVPYILGAAQLRDTCMTPSEMTDVSLYPHSRQREPRVGPRLTPQATLFYKPPRSLTPLPNMYTSALARIHSLKRGPFSEHSPLLYDISHNVTNWPKVFTGLLKMYDAECLLKRPVVQHFVFGNVGYVWPDEPTRKSMLAHKLPANRVAMSSFAPMHHHPPLHTHHAHSAAHAPSTRHGTE